MEKIPVQTNEKPKLSEAQVADIGRFRSVAKYVSSLAAYFLTSCVQLPEKETSTPSPEVIPPHIALIKESAESNDLHFNVLVPNSNGDYIVHIGQLHHTEGIERDFELSNKVIDTQKKIEDFLDHIIANSDTKPVVFAEGWNDATCQPLVPMYRSIQNYLNRTTETLVDSDPNNDISLASVMLEIFQATKNYFTAIKEKPSSMLKGTSVPTQTYEAFVLLQLYQDAIETIRSKRELTKEEESDFDFCLRIIKGPLFMHDNISELDVRYFANNDVLATKTGLILRGAESRDLSDKAFSVLDKVRELPDFKDVNSMSEDERRVFFENWLGTNNINKQKFADVVMSEREQYAFAAAVCDRENTGNKVTYVLYGSAHDFSDEVNTFNKENDNPVGLIKVEYVK